MREIKFRGISHKTGEFVYGSLVVTTDFVKHKPKQQTKTWIVTKSFGNGGWFNVQVRYSVKPETVGQFTGLIDKNGKEIYEGDGLEDEYGEFFGFVIFEDGCFTLNDDSLIWKIKENKLTVVGNIREEK